MWSEDWNELRERVLKRDGYACRVRDCDTTREDVGVQNLHAHHVRPRADGGPDERANLITLCGPCHNRKHSGRTTYLDAEFIQVARGYGPLSTGEVADWVGCSRTTARRRMGELETDGEVVGVERNGTTAWRPPRSVLGRVLARLNPFA